MLGLKFGWLDLLGIVLMTFGFVLLLTGNGFGLILLVTGLFLVLLSGVRERKRRFQRRV
jgi:thiosulfate reductase cytochrome b subunit